MLITLKCYDNTCEYCGNTHDHEYCANTWKMCSPASAIFASIVTILVCFKAILMDFKAFGRHLLWNWLLMVILTENLFKIAYNYCDYYTCRWTHFSSIGSILGSITPILNDYCHNNACKYWAGE